MGGNGTMARALASVSEPLLANSWRQRSISYVVSVAKMQPLVHIRAPNRKDMLPVTDLYLGHGVGQATKITVKTSEVSH